MPITVTLPPEAGSPHPLGPGLVVAWEFIGPIQPGSQWQVDLKSTEVGSGTVQHFLPASGGSQTIVLGDPSSGGQIIAPTYLNEHGTPAILTVQLLDPGGVQADIGNRAGTMDAISGVPWLVTHQAQQPPAEGSYLPADRQVAQNTLNAVRSTFLGAGGLPGLVLDIGQLFTTPPVEILRRAELLILTGRGVLVYPAGGSEVQAYGAYIELLTPPPGAGFDEGVIQEFEVRVAQFAVLGRHGNTQSYLKYLYDLAHGGQYLIWGAPFPRQIQYDITPGFSIGWRWLVLGVQP